MTSIISWTYLFYFVYESCLFTIRKKSVTLFDRINLVALLRKGAAQEQRQRLIRNLLQKFRHDGNLNQRISGRNGKQWLTLGYILKIDLKGLIDWKVRVRGQG